MVEAVHRHLTCVLADDHDTVRGAVRRQLDRLDWVTVVAEAADGASALDAIVEHRPDVAVVDVRMPELTGFEVCSRLRDDALATRVVLYSALAGPENVELGLRLGAAAFVSKDEGFAPLRAALDSIARGSSHS